MPVTGAAVAALVDDRVGRGRCWDRCRRGVGIGVVAVLSGEDGPTGELAVPEGDEEAARLVDESVAAAEEGRLDGAVAHATAATELNPESRDLLAMAHINRAYAYMLLDRLDDAATDADRAIELGPTDPWLLARALIVQSAVEGLTVMAPAVEAATMAIQEASSRRHTGTVPPRISNSNDTPKQLPTPRTPSTSPRTTRRWATPSVSEARPIKKLDGSILPKPTSNSAAR